MTDEIKRCCMNCVNIDFDEGDTFTCLNNLFIYLSRPEAELLYCGNYIQMPTTKEIRQVF